MSSGPPGTNLATVLQEEFDRRGETLGQAARRVRRRTDDEAIHDLRVAARRLETALEVWRGGLRPKPMARARRMLRKSRRRLGGAREHEVHVALLEDLMKGARVTLRLAAAPVLNRLRRARDRARRRASRRALGRTARRLRRLMRGRRWLAPIPAGLALGDARSRERAVADEAREAVRAARTAEGDRELHAARVGAKKWRYAVECLAAVEGRAQPHAGGSAAAIASRLDLLRGIQEALGDAHDMATLRAVLERETRRLERRGLPESAAALRPLLERIAERRGEAIARFRTLIVALDEAQNAAEAGGARPVPRIVPARSATRS